MIANRQAGGQAWRLDAGRLHQSRLSVVDADQEVREVSLRPVQLWTNTTPAQTKIVERQ